MKIFVDGKELRGKAQVRKPACSWFRILVLRSEATSQSSRSVLAIRNTVQSLCPDIAAVKLKQTS